MGIFGSSKKTYVSSVAYPLGEDGEGRTEYLKYTVLNATLQNRPIGEAITQGYLRGQGMSLRNAFKYARDEYTNGVPRSNSAYFDQPDLTALRSILAQAHGSNIEFVTTMVGTADFVWWAEQYLTETYGYDRVLGEFIKPPAGVDVDAAVAYDLEPSGLVRILLMNAGGATTVLEWRPTGLDRMRTYVHSCFRTVQVFEGEGSVTTRAPLPGEIDSVSVSLNIVDRVGERQETLVRTEVDIVAGVATVTVTRTTTVTSRPRYFIYKLGSGTWPTLDAWSTEADLGSPYYPSIPVRINNTDWTTPAKRETELYKTSKKLLKKVGADFQKIADQINTNPDVKEIDYAYVVFGVDLGTESQEGKRYLFRFFEHLRNISQVTQADYSTWHSAFQASPTTNVVTPKTNNLQIYSPKDRANNHDVKLQWNYINTTIKSGEAFPGAKPKDCAILTSGQRLELQLMFDIVMDNSKLLARRQIDADTYEELEIAGLVYENFVYKGKSVIISAYEGINDPDENGFIIPLNQQIIRATPMIEVTDLAYQVLHVVFNCYKVVKKKWYQTGIFKVVLIIVAIAIIFFTWGAGTPAAAGMIAGALIGIGISVTLAIALAATIYVLAMMIIMNILTDVATDVFGEKWGAVLAIIGTFVAMNWSNLAGAVAGTTQVTAQTILSATSAVANAYGAYAAGQMTQLQKEALGLSTEFDKQMKEIEELTKQNLGTNLDMIDIQGYTDATFVQLFERPQTFLDRTLLTGSDICAITSGMVNNFAAVGLQLPNNG